MSKRKVIVISSLLLYAIIVPVFAYMYFYRTTPTYVATGIVLRSYQTPTMKLGLYWDAACTQNVTTIDFGDMTHPNQITTLWRLIYIKNEGSVWNSFFFNSTLSSITAEIHEWWGRYLNWQEYPINGTRIEVGQVVETYYQIRIPPYAAVRTYNWTLTVWGENWY